MFDVQTRARQNGWESGVEESEEEEVNLQLSKDAYVIMLWFWLDCCGLGGRASAIILMASGWDTTGDLPVDWKLT